MKRKQLYITSQQDVMLKETAAKYRVSEGEVVRAALDARLGRGVGPRTGPNQAVWQEELAFIRQRSRSGVGGSSGTREGARRWRRSDLYGS
ncbi:MAG: hypothetical protein ACOX4G_01710 [Limnochordia bacterium]